MGMNIFIIITTIILVAVAIFSFFRSVKSDIRAEQSKYEEKQMYTKILEMMSLLSTNEAKKEYLEKGSKSMNVQLPELAESILTYLTENDKKASVEDVRKFLKVSRSKLINNLNVLVLGGYIDVNIENGLEFLLLKGTIE